MSEDRFKDITMLKPDEVEFLEQNCGLSFRRAREAAGEGESIPFWSFLVSDEPLTERDIQIAHEMIAEYENSTRPDPEVG